MAAILFPHRRISGHRPLFTGVNWGSPLAQGLRAWFPQHEPTGTIDVTRGLRLTRTEAVDTQPSEFGGYVLSRASGSLFITTPLTAPPFTIAIWFKSSNVTANQCLVSIASDASNAYQLTARGADAGDFLKLYMGVGGDWSRVGVSTQAYEANRWHLAVGVVASDTSRTVYLDGRAGSTSTTSGTISPTTMTLGYFYGGGDQLSGLVGDCFLYERALSAAEVWALYAPATRWDMYLRPSRRLWLDLVTVTAVTADSSDAITVSDNAAQTLGLRVSAAEWSGSDTVASSNW